MASNVILLDYWASPFAMRAKIALMEKGVEFEARQEDLFGGKSELLLESNPIYKKVPVLVHDGKAVSESLVILDYIEDVWPAPPLLPEDPYARANSRFWADIVDKKLFEAGTRIWKSKGEAQETAKKDFFEAAKLLEGALGDQDYFNGDSFGYVDVAAIPFTSWFHAYEQCGGGFSVHEECPKLCAWARRCMARDSVAKVLPDPTKVCELLCNVKKSLGIE